MILRQTALKADLAPVTSCRRRGGAHGQSVSLKQEPTAITAFLLR